MSKYLGHLQLMLIATTLLSTTVLGQEPLLTQTTPLATPPSARVDSNVGNAQTNEADDREFSTVVRMRHVQANWVVMNIQQLFRKQKEQFSIIGDEGQVVVRGNQRIIDEIRDVVDAIDRHAEPRSAPKRNALPAGIGAEIEVELIDAVSPEGRDRLKAALRKEFELNQNQLRESLMELSSKVKEAQELLARRDQLADQIIDLRFRELIAAKPSGEEKHAAESVGSTLPLNPSIAPSAVPLSGIPEQPSVFQAGVRMAGKEPQIFEATSAQPMRTPDQYVKLIQEYRGNFKRYRANHSARQAIIDQLSKSENLDDQDKNNLKLQEEGLVSDKAASGRSLNNWNRSWSEYRTQLELLRLDINEAETILSSLEKKAVQAKQQVSQGLLSQQELDEHFTRIDLAKIKIDRAKKIFELYAEIEKFDPELNPSKVEQAAP